jgi:hypothetical protein
MLSAASSSQSTIIVFDGTKSMASKSKQDRCTLTIAQLLRRAKLRVYQGNPATAVGSTYNYAFAISDQVPANKYWAVLAASGFMGGSEGTDPVDMGCALYIVFPNAPQPIPSNLQSVGYKQWPIFLSQVGGVSNYATVCNGLPTDPASTIRIDEQVGQDAISNAGATAPYEVALIRGKKPLLVNELCYLLATTAVNGVVIGNHLSSQVTLKLLVAEMNQYEDVDLG